MTTVERSQEQLIQECQGLVRTLAHRIYRGMPGSIDIEDLVSYGQVGLAEAARDFDPARGTQFSTFAYYRIRGAIYDGISKMAWFSRSRYRHLRYEQMAGEVLAVDAQSKADQGEARLEDEVRWLSNLSSSLAVVYLATQRDDEGDDNTPEDHTTPTPAHVAMNREACQKLHQLIDALPAEAGQLIRSAYFEGLTLQEAGQRLGVSKAWASRLHAKTLQRLARSLRLLGVADES